jgi:MipA family protein
VYLGDGLGGLSAGAGVYLVESGGLSWSADLALTSDRPEDRADALAGMSDRGFGVFAGSTLAYRLGPVEAFATAAVGVEGRMGAMGVTGLSLGQRVGERWFVGASGAAAFGDCANLRWDFGVSEAQAARRRELLESGAPGLRPEDGVPYTPRCGLRELRATGSLGYVLSPKLSLFGSVTGVRLERGAAESPLTRERNTWEAGLGLAWRF